MSNSHDSIPLTNLVSDADFCARTLAIIRRVQSAETVEAAFAVMVDATLAFGADQSVFLSYVKDDSAGESLRFLVAGDPSWCVEFQQHGWFLDDAWLMHAMCSSEPIADSRIDYRTTQQRKLREVAASHGVRSAYIVPAPVCSGLSRMGVLLLASHRAGYFDGAGVDMLKIVARCLALELHDWWVCRIREDMIVAHGITDLELRLLRQQRDGKVTKQIAAELGLTEPSVNNRFQRLNAKLNTPNRKASARLAAEYGLI